MEVENTSTPDENVVYELNDMGKIEALNKELDEDFQEYAHYREQFEKDWEEFEKVYDGDHWKLAKERNKKVKNWIFRTIEAEVPVLCDSKPASDVIPYDGKNEEGPNNEVKAKVLSDCTKWVYNDQDFNIKVAQSARSFLKTGNAYQYIDFDPDLDNGEGNITIDNISWRQVWLDPGVTEIDKCSKVYIHFPSRIEDLKRRFPGKEIPKVTVDDAIRGMLASDGTPSDRWSPNSAVGTVSRYAGEEFTVLEEIWMRDYTLIDIPEEETSHEIVKETKQLIDGQNPDIHKFEDHDAHIESHQQTKQTILDEKILPFLGLQNHEIPQDVLAKILEDPTFAIELNPSIDLGVIEEVALLFHVIDDHIKSHEMLAELNPDSKKPKYKNNMRLIMRVAHEILYDGEPPITDGIVPLVPYYCYKDEECIYGFGEIKNLMGAQMSYNEIDWSEYKGLKKNSNSGWILDDNSNVKNDTLTNEEGIVIKKKQGTEVKRIEPGQVSPQLQERMNRDLSAISDISGVNEPTQGKRPSGITAASAIRELREQSVGRIRLKSSFMETFSILRCGKLIAARVIKYWSSERKLRLWDDFGRVRYVDFSPDEFKDFKYDVLIVPGSTAGIDKETIYNIYSDLTIKGLIPPKIFFQVTDLPFKHKVLQELEVMDQTKMMMQQLQSENEQLKQVILKIDEEKNQESKDQPVSA